MSINESTCKTSSNGFWNCKPFLSWLSSSASVNAFFFADFSSWTNSQVNVEGKRTFTTPSVLNQGSQEGQGARYFYLQKGCCISSESDAFLITLVLNNSKLLGVAFSACASLRLLAPLCNLTHPRDPSPSLVIHWRTCDITALRRCPL